MTIRDKIKSIIEDSLRALRESGVLSSQELPEVKIEYPADFDMGDYSTNTAFILAKSEGQEPLLIARMLAEKIMTDKHAQKMFKKVEAAGAGFVNFKFSQEFLQKQLSNAGHTISHVNVGKGKKLNIEFLSANPTGKFQVGNGRGAFYGDVLGNILELAGYEVTKEYYVNNAKTSNQIIELGKTALKQGDKYLTPYVEEKIKELSAQLASLDTTLPSPLPWLRQAGLRKEGGELGGGMVSPPYEGGESAEGGRGGSEVFPEAGFLLAQEIQKDNQGFLKKIGINYDTWTREQEDLIETGFIKKTFALLKKKGLVYEKDGAQWLNTVTFGDDKDKVLIRSTGEHGYFLADIAYHLHKIKRGYKVIIDIFGADHQGHVLPMKIAMRILEYKGKFDVLVTQLVQAKGGGKFSKRAGNVIELEELINEVGVDVARYFYLMKSLDTQMEFDMELAKEQSDKNPVYYVQYAHARMASILRTAGNSPLLTKERGVGGEVAERLNHPAELNLIRYIIRWPEVIEDTSSDYQAQRVIDYTYDLAAVFNQFYRDCKVISSDKELRQERLVLVIITQKVLKEVLGALGISAPERM